MRRFLAGIAALCLAACASAYVEGDTSWSGGFDDTQINETDWTVSYYGNGYTTHETVETYWLYRAAELTLEKGYSGFRLISRTGSREPTISRLIEEGFSGKPGLDARIRMLKNPLPDQPGAVFDALAVKTFLAPYVTGPKCEGNVCPHVPEYLYPGFGRKILGEAAAPLAPEAPAIRPAPPPPRPEAPPKPALKPIRF